MNSQDLFFNVEGSQNASQHISYQFLKSRLTPDSMQVLTKLSPEQAGYLLLNLSTCRTFLLNNLLEVCSGLKKVQALSLLTCPKLNSDSWHTSQGMKYSATVTNWVEIPIYTGTPLLLWVLASFLIEGMLDLQGRQRTLAWLTVCGPIHFDSLYIKPRKEELISHIIEQVGL